MKTLLTILLLCLSGGAIFAGQAVSQSQSENAAEKAYDRCIRTHINKQGGLTPQLVTMCRALKHE